MKLKIIAQWQQTELYDSGIKEFTINWNEIAIPRDGDEFLLYDYIKDENIIDIFEYQGKEHNVFEWIQKKMQWTVGNACWSKGYSNSLVTVLMYG